MAEPVGVHDRLLEFEGWRAKTDATLSGIGDALVRINSRLDDDSKNKTVTQRTTIGFIVGSIGIVGAAVTFFVNSEINTSLFPIASRIASVEATVTARGDLIARMQDTMEKGRQDRIAEEIAVRERLIRIETRLQDRGIMARDNILKEPEGTD